MRERRATYIGVRAMNGEPDEQGQPMSQTSLQQLLGHLAYSNCTPVRAHARATARTDAHAEA